MTCEPSWAVVWAQPLEPFWANLLADAAALSLAVPSVVPPVPLLATVLPDDWVPAQGGVLAARAARG